MARDLSFSFPRLAALMAALLALAGCSKPAPAPEPVRAVKVMTVALEGYQSEMVFSGEVRARVESRLGFRVGGKIIRRPVEPGQQVKAGALLAQLDPQDYRLAVEAARAQVAAAATQRDLAGADLRRYQSLREQNFISGAEIERRETAFKAAQAQLEQAQAQLAVQANQAGYADLVADVSGVVTAVEAEPGQVVSAGATVVRIAQDGPRDVVFSVPENRVADVRPGSAVVVRLWAGQGDMSGKVREVAASADPATRTFLVKVSLDAAARPPLGATVSLQARALSAVGRPVIKLPTSALRQEGQGSAVWVLDSATMKLKSQPVVVATADGNSAVIASGLAPGMQVVTAGVHVLSPGQAVTIWQERTPPASGAGASPARPAASAAAATVASAPAR